MGLWTMGSQWTPVLGKMTENSTVFRNLTDFTVLPDNSRTVFLFFLIIFKLSNSTYGRILP